VADGLSDSTELLGRSTTREFVVSGADTAAAVGSGSLPVLGTPVLLAWCEAVTCDVLGLSEPVTSVGTRVALEHLAASKVGAITCTFTTGQMPKVALG
jgi:fluoroacetyl-CoA thioesterase